MRMIFVNLPVKDLDASKAFFGELGFEFNSEFSDDKAACMVVDENIYFMLLVEERFKDFINDEIADAASTTETINCLSAKRGRRSTRRSRRRARRAASRGSQSSRRGRCTAAASRIPTGHVWEIMHMDQG